MYVCVCVCVCVCVRVCLCVCVWGGGQECWLVAGQINYRSLSPSLLKIFIAMQTLFFIPFINYVSNHLNIWRGLSWCIAVAALWWCGRAQSSWTWRAASRKKAKQTKRRRRRRKKKKVIIKSLSVPRRAEKVADSRWPSQKWAWEWVKEREREVWMKCLELRFV